MFLTFEEIRKNLSIKTYIKKADDALASLGYTEHSFPHVLRVSDVAGKILKILNYSDHDVELVKIAGYLHDIGNLVNRVDHAQSGAVMAFRILDKLGMDTEDIADISLSAYLKATKTPKNVSMIHISGRGTAFLRKFQTV